MSDESLDKTRNVLLNQGLIERWEHDRPVGHRATVVGQQFLNKFRRKDICPDHPDPSDDPLDMEVGKKIVVQVGDRAILAGVLLGPAMCDEAAAAADLLGRNDQLRTAVLSMGLAASHVLVRHSPPDVPPRRGWTWDVGLTARANETFLHLLAAILGTIPDTRERARIKELVDHVIGVRPLRLLDSPGESSAPGGPKFSLLG